MLENYDSKHGPNIRALKFSPMSSDIPQQWFEMPEYRRRSLSDAVWVPLRAAETIPNVNGSEEVFCCGSVAFPPEKRGEAERLGWSDLGIGHSAGPYASHDHPYKTAEIYQQTDGEDLGVELIFVQDPGGGLRRIWHVNQDLILALNLVQEADVWVRPEEGFVEVMRQRRDAANKIVAIEIKREFLGDYLAARGLALRIVYYRQRLATVGDLGHISWPEAGLSDAQPHHRFEAHVFEVDAKGRPYGATGALFQVWRTDVDPEDEVPVFGPEADTNTDGQTTYFKRGGQKFFRIEGEQWREEWIEAGDRSERVRHDEPAETLSFVIDAAGTRENSNVLDNPDVGRWLWFDPRIVSAILGRRGGALGWYTRETGYVSLSKGWDTHFGLNRRGLVTVYAYDIAKLPLWQRRVWSGFNVTPEDAVSSELLAAQMQTRPAKTLAPEAMLPRLFQGLDALAEDWLGAPLFLSHDATDQILANVHRFRALEHGGVLALAKDLARLTVDRIDCRPLQALVQPPKGDNWGSLKSLERALAMLGTAEAARTLLTPLVGIYQLRLGDAHLPSERIAESFTSIGLDVSAPPLIQGQRLLEIAAICLEHIGDEIHDALQVSRRASVESQTPNAT